MSNDPEATVRGHVEAVIDLVIGRQKMRPGLFFCGGDPMTADQRFDFAQAAAAHATDVVHLQFNKVAGGCYMTDVTIIVPRDAGCLVAAGCSLYLAPGARRALIVPCDEVRGHFSAIPGELIHRDRKPADLEAGVRRAAHRLAKMVAHRPPLRQDVDITIIDRG